MVKVFEGKQMMHGT